MTGERVDLGSERYDALYTMDRALCVGEAFDSVALKSLDTEGMIARLNEQDAELHTLRAQVAALAGEKADETSVFGKYGNCPVQIERTIGDRQFYFRARGEEWSLCVGDADDMSEFAAVNGEEILSGVIHVPS